LLTSADIYSSFGSYQEKYRGLNAIGVNVDHIGGASLVLQGKPRVQIVAESGTADFLREMHDPHRPIPTRTFKDRETLKLGSLTADMKVGHWHSPEGDLLIYVPDRKFVICIDSHHARLRRNGTSGNANWRIHARRAMARQLRIDYESLCHSRIWRS
jgi:glyoxylase-like metal-dependent hydrolase (beta-lactamase superfamily II)